MSPAYSAGRAAWPDVGLSPERFAAHLAARALPPDAAYGADVYLACACLHGEPQALRAFEAAYLTQLPRMLTRLRPTSEVVDEVGQILREKLFVGPAPKIAEYSGRGALAAWLRVVAVRLAIDLQRGRRAADAAPPDRPLSTPAPSPELQLLRERYRPHFQGALGEALGALGSEQRLLLKLHFVDGMNLEELGRLFKVNRSTIFRRVGACMEQVLAAMRARLGAELGVTTTEMQSLAGALQSDLELSLGDYLRP